LRASSNSPVIADVRWLENSTEIAFLGRDGSTRPQLFIVGVSTGVRRRLSQESDYVTAFDVRGQTVAYTTLLLGGQREALDDDLQSVTDRGGIYRLLYPDRDPCVGVDEESVLLSCPNELHVTRNGKIVPMPLSWQGKPLNLYAPLLSLSPDGNSLITLAPVRSVPTLWSRYVTANTYMKSHWNHANKWDTDKENPWKAQQYVVIGLHSFRVEPLLEAPAGPGTFYFIDAASKVVWSQNGKRVLLSNAMLPLSKGAYHKVNALDIREGAVAIVDLETHSIEPITNVPSQTGGNRYLSEITWSESRGVVEVRYASRPDNVVLPEVASYQLKAGTWMPMQTKPLTSLVDRSNDIFVDENLNQPPLLAAHSAPGNSRAILWNPNATLARVSLGTAAMYKWTSHRTGASWSGILVLPPGYKPGVRYPLVIQTHGYEAQKFFADGMYTTGSGGRALAASGIVVLQTDERTTPLNTPGEGSDAVDKFRSAIEQLTADGTVDRRRVGVIGFSYTCFEVLYTLTHSPGLFAAATVTDGNNKGYLVYLFDVDIGGSSNPFIKPIEETYGSRPFGSGLAKWAEETPSFNLDKVSAPLQIWSLERGSLMGQWEIYAGLRAWRKPVEMLWVPSQRFIPHVLVKPTERYLSQAGAVDWFRFWLQGYEDHDAVKADQYTRWRELKKLKETEHTLQ
jgi:hypothetical protein